MGLLDLLFGISESVNKGKKKPIDRGWSPFGNDYDDYYSDLHDDAMSGDIAAQEEMREEFGDDWEGEY